MVNLRELTAFRAVMTMGTTIGASKALHLSQPSVSRLLADLELRLRVCLFRREGGRLVPTHDAHLLLEEVERAFESLESLSEYTSRLSQTVSRPVRLVVSPGLAYRFAPAAIALFERAYPNVPVTVDMRTTELATEMVISGQADLAVSLLPAEHPGIRITPLVDVPIVCLLQADHPLSSRETLTPEDLSDAPLIMISRRYPARIRVDEAFERAGAEARIRVESGTTAAACGIARTGLGIALVNAFMAQEFAGNDLVLRPFRPVIRNAFGVLLPRKAPARATVALLDCIRAAAVEQAGPYALAPESPPAFDGHQNSAPEFWPRPVA